MEVKIEKPKSYIREVHVSLPYSNLEQERSKIAQEYKNSAAVPGFRKGKAPVSIILNTFAKEIENEAKDKVVKRAFIQILKENNLNPITYAEIENIQASKDTGNISFRARFQIIPPFKLKLEGIRTTYKTRKVSGTDVKRVLLDLLKKYSTLKPASGPSKTGDFIEFDYIAFNKQGNEIDAIQGMTVELEKKKKGSLHSLLDGVNGSQHIKGEIEYPQEFPVDELHGQSIVIEISVREVKERITPKLDDDFAKTVGFDSLMELKESIEQQLSKEQNDKARNLAKQKLLDTLIKENDFEVPDALVEFYFRQQQEIAGKTKGIDKGVLRKLAERRARINILLDRIAEKETMEVPEKEINDFIEKEAYRQGVEKQKLRAYLEQSGGIDEITTMLRREKVFDFILIRYLVKG